MTVTTPHSPARRSFLRQGVIGGGAFMLGLYSDGALAKPAAGDAGEVRLNILVSIAADGKVVLVSKNPDMGQGVKTAMPMIMAEELDVAWRDVRVVQGDLNREYNGQMSGGSNSIRTNFDQLRQLGAAARAMLVQAAAQSWGVAARECSTAEGSVVHAASGRRLGYGALAQAASKLPVPSAAQLKLKDPASYRLLGKRIGGVDNAAIVTGKPLFGIDVQLPGMLHAVYDKCPVFGGKPLGANLDEVKALPGVHDAFIVEGTNNLNGLMPGVAIVANSTWAAFRARKQLKVQWDEGPGATQDWAGFVKTAQAASSQPAENVLRKDGDVEAALAGAAKKVEAQYTYPFVAHACMEPQNCTAWFRPDGMLELWVPTQTPVGTGDAVAAQFGVAKEKVIVHPTRSGGAFGRRAAFDFVHEAVSIARRVQAPVKLTWSREDDMQHDHFRGGGFHFMRGGVDASGKVVAWHDHFLTFANRIMREGRSVLWRGSGGSLFGDEFPGRWVPNCLLEQTPIECNIPMGPWRAPGSNVFAWVIQSFVDELAHAAGRDPLAFRLELLGERDIVPGTGERGQAYDAGRMKRVLKELGEKSGWGKRLPRGRGQGVAFHFSHHGYIAQVAEVTVSRDGKLKVDRVVVVADVGSPIVNLSGAEHQVQGSVIDGLSTLLYPEMRIERGRAVQSNFHEYPMLRMPETPASIEVHFLKTDHPPTGLGEPALPPLAPAVCNAIFAATGKRVRELPLSKTDLSRT